MRGLCWGLGSLSPRAGPWAGTWASDLTWRRDSSGFVSSWLGGLVFVFWAGEACLGIGLALVGVLLFCFACLFLKIIFFLGAFIF